MYSVREKLLYLPLIRNEIIIYLFFEDWVQEAEKVGTVLVVLPVLLSLLKDVMMDSRTSLLLSSIKCLP